VKDTSRICKVKKLQLGEVSCVRNSNREIILFYVNYLIYIPCIFYYDQQMHNVIKKYHNYRNTRLKLLETKVAICFNRIRKQQLQKHQAKVTKNECSNLV